MPRLPRPLDVAGRHSELVVGLVERDVAHARRRRTAETTAHRGVVPLMTLALGASPIGAMIEAERRAGRERP